MQSGTLKYTQKDSELFEKACQSLCVPFTLLSTSEQWNEYLIGFYSLQTVANVGFHMRQMEEMGELDSKLSYLTKDYATI